MRIEAVVLIAALLALSDRSQAQVVETKKALTLEGAKAAAAAATAEARKGNEGASVAVVDEGGNLMYLERMQPTFPMGATIATEKARRRRSSRSPPRSSRTLSSAAARHSSTPGRRRSTAASRSWSMAR